MADRGRASCTSSHGRQMYKGSHGLPAPVPASQTGLHLSRGLMTLNMQACLSAKRHCLTRNQPPPRPAHALTLRRKRQTRIRIAPTGRRTWCWGLPGKLSYRRLGRAPGWRRAACCSRQSTQCPPPRRRPSCHVPLPARRSVRSSWLRPGPAPSVRHVSRCHACNRRNGSWTGEGWRGWESVLGWDGEMGRV